MRQSVATIDSPEFINLTPMDNPMISKCEIKVMYLKENRNKSFISKEVAKKMAHSLPGSPIVGYYKEENEDFADHGQRVIIDDEGVKFEKLTTPYGFVAPDAEVWFQKFEDTDEFGVVTEREYMMTTGLLWTGRYPEVERVLTSGSNGQSMELHENSVEGKWATNHNSGIEFFIINDAIFSALTILGESVEPCFEGADITKPKLSSSFSLMDDEFRGTLFSMMQDLQSAYQSNEGGLNMTKEELIGSGRSVSEFTAEERVLFTAEELAEMEATEAAAFTAAEEERVAEEARVAAEFAAQRDAEEAEAARLAAEKYAVLQGKYDELQTQFTTLETEITTLREYKNSSENKAKEDLIASFYMLSEDDKADVIANKATYSLDEIEAKLAVVAFRNKVSFGDDGDGDGTGEPPIVTFDLNGSGGSEDAAPEFVQVLRTVKQN